MLFYNKEEIVTNCVYVRIYKNDLKIFHASLNFKTSQNHFTMFKKYITKNFNEQLKITCGDFPKIHFLKTNFFFHGSLLKFVKKKI